MGLKFGMVLILKKIHKICKNQICGSAPLNNKSFVQTTVIGNLHLHDTRYPNKLHVPHVNSFRYRTFSLRVGSHERFHPDANFNPG